MKCPLFTIGGYENSHLPKFGFNDCLKEECAWWDDKYSQCVSKTDTEQLLRIANALNAILAKMPNPPAPTH